MYNSSSGTGSQQGSKIEEPKNNNELWRNNRILSRVDSSGAESWNPKEDLQHRILLRVEERKKLKEDFLIKEL